MEIENAQLSAFCNDTLRRISDDLAAVAQSLPGILDEYEAKNLGTVISDAGSENLIGDGSDSDGRTRVTGGDVWNFVTLLQDLRTFLTEGRMDVLAKWQVNAYRP